MKSKLFLATVLCLPLFGWCAGPAVLVVGAGPAGIAAAARLLAAGLADLAVVEAEPRVGGRIHSVRFGAGVVDLGAEYCHGVAKNVVYELAAPYGLLRPARAGATSAIVYSNGSALPAELSKELAGTIEHCFANDDPNRSLRDIFMKYYNETLVEKYKNDPDTINVINAAPRLLESYFNSLEGAFSWNEVKYDSDYETLKGEDHIWTGVGYITILDILMQSYPNTSAKLPIEGKLRLNETVEKIDWSSSDGVTVTTSKQTYTAEHVIFTPSVGVLRHDHGKLFEPQLPADKRRALEAIGFDGVMKIVLEFEEKWWYGEQYVVSFMWSVEDLAKARGEFALAGSDGEAWPTRISSLVSVLNNERVLIAWLTGDVVPKVERLPLEEVKRGCEYVVRKFFGSSMKKIEIRQLLRTGWVSNPHFRGTYSFERVGYGANGSYQEVLARELTDSTGMPVVLFAGEATSPTHYSTVHGAIETGYRAADRLISMKMNT